MLSGGVLGRPLLLRVAGMLVGSGATESVCGLERTREGATMGNFNFSYLTTL